jgi:hypothetical protein
LNDGVRLKLAEIDTDRFVGVGGAVPLREGSGHAAAGIADQPNPDGEPPVVVFYIGNRRSQHFRGNVVRRQAID